MLLGALTLAALRHHANGFTLSKPQQVQHLVTVIKVQINTAVFDAVFEVRHNATMFGNARHHAVVGAAVLGKVDHPSSGIKPSLNTGIALIVKVDKPLKFCNPST